MTRTLFTLILCTLFSPLLQAAETQQATVLQATALLAEPYSDATVLTKLPAKQQVTILQRSGGWYQVRHGKQSGWLRMSRVRFGDGATAQGEGGGLSQTLRFLSSGRSGASGVTVATGIRGLDAADVSNAKPNHKAVERLERYQAKPAQARRFAKQASLKSQPLGYFGEE